MGVLFSENMDQRRTRFCPGLHADVGPKLQGKAARGNMSLVQSNGANFGNQTPIDCASLICPAGLFNSIVRFWNQFRYGQFLNTVAASQTKGNNRATKAKAQLGERS